MPVTTRIVATRCTMTVLRSSFSRPNLGQIKVRTIPIKKIAMGTEESMTAEARATVGAAMRASR